MTTVQFYEALLVTANCIVWLGPFILALKRRSASLIHPSSMLPLFIMMSILIAITEHWFGWLRGNSFYGAYGLRLTTRIYAANIPNFFLLPLFVVFLAGIAYHFGIKMGCGRIVAGFDDRFQLKGDSSTIEKKYSLQLFIRAFFVSLACITPFLLFGQGQGFFWTAALFYAFYFVPVILMNQSFFQGLIFTVVGLAAIGLRGSKGDFIYYLLPLMVFNHGFLTVSNLRAKLGRIFILALFFIITFRGTIDMLNLRGVDLQEKTPVNALLEREYGFEVFSILVNTRSTVNAQFEGSWIVGEMVDALPSLFGIEKPHLGRKVASIFMPDDYARLPDAGFYRFFLFAFYYDLGWIGSILGSMATGYVFASVYKIALHKSNEENNLWPLMIYLPIPVYAEWIANGSLSYYFVHVVLAMFIVWLIVRFAFWRRVAYGGQIYDHKITVSQDVNC